MSLRGCSDAQIPRQFSRTFHLGHVMTLLVESLECWLTKCKASCVEDFSDCSVNIHDLSLKSSNENTAVFEYRTSWTFCLTLGAIE